MSIFHKFFLVSALTLAPLSGQALTVVDSFGVDLFPFNAQITDDSAGLTLLFDDDDFFGDEDPSSTIFPFFVDFRPLAGGFTRLRVQSDVCEDGSCGFAGFGPGPLEDFGFGFDGEDVPRELIDGFFPGDVDVNETFILPDSPGSSDGPSSFFFTVEVRDPFVRGSEQPSITLTLDYFAEGTPSVVPLPAPGLLLLGALGGLAWMRHRKAKHGAPAP